MRSSILAAAGGVTTRVGQSRSAAYLAYGAMLGSSQMLFLTYAPVASRVHAPMGVSEASIGNLAIVVPVACVLLASWSGRLLDRDFPRALAVGALFTAAGAMTRAVAVTSYDVALAGQVLVAIGQPYAINGMTKFTVRNTSPAKRTAGVSFLSACVFLGILVAAAGGGLLLDRGGLDLLVRLQSGFAVLACVAVLLTLRVQPLEVREPVGRIRFASLPNRATLGLLGGGMFLGFGIFTVLVTWLDTLEGNAGHANLGKALVIVITLAGIAGAAILPSLAQSTGRRRETAAWIFAVSGICLVGLAIFNTTPMLVICSAGLGFFLMAGLPLIYDWSEVVVGPDLAATAIGLLTLLANIGGTVLAIVAEAMLAHPTAAFLMLAATCLVGVELSLRIASQPPVGLPQESGWVGPTMPTRSPRTRHRAHMNPILVVACVVACVVLARRNMPQATDTT